MKTISLTKGNLVSGKNTRAKRLYIVLLKTGYITDSGNLTGVLFIDLSKAFDTVNHEVLLHKLFSIGVCSNTYSLFKSYLENRLHCVRWKGFQSYKKPINIGVPQGSVLGPLFFILFVNDYPECLEYSEAHMYADYTTRMFRVNL